MAEENKIEEKKIDLKTIWAEVEQYIWKAQQSYESAVYKYGYFRDQYVDLTVKYEKKLAQEVCRIKEQNDGKVTNAKVMAKGNCDAEQKEMLKAETKYKYYNKLVEAMKERIQTIKFIGRIKYQNLENPNPKELK